MSETLKQYNELVKQVKKMPTMRILLLTTCTAVIVIAYRLPELIPVLTTALR